MTRRKPRTIAPLLAAAASLAIAGTAHAQPFSDPITTGLPDRGGGASSYGDFDGDGDFEFIFSWSSSRIYIYDWNATTRGFDAYRITEDNPPYDLNRFGGDLTTADIDGDGHLDIVVPNSNNASGPGDIAWYKNPGTPLAITNWTRNVVTTWPAAQDGIQSDDDVRHMSEIEAADIDGDGDIDIVTRDVDHGLFVAINNGPGNTWTRRHVATQPREGLAMRDLDGDGDLDIVINGVWFQTPGTGAAPGNLATGPFNQHTFAAAEYPAPGQANADDNYAKKVVVADMNGDGRPDIIVANAEQLAGGSGGPTGMRIYFAGEDPTDPDGWIEHLLQENINVTIDGDDVFDFHERFSLHNLQIGDIDGDGDLDIVSAISDVGRDDAPGQVFALLNDGDALNYTYLKIDSDFAYQISLADADGDGDPDIFAPAGFNGGQVRYFENLVPEPVAGAMMLGGTAMLLRRHRKRP